MGDPSWQLQDGLLDRAGVFRVDVNGAPLECLEANEGAAEGITALAGEATILQKLGHDLGQHLSLDVLLATDDDGTLRLRSKQARGQRQEDDQDDADATAPMAIEHEQALKISAIIANQRRPQQSSAFRMASSE